MISIYITIDYQNEFLNQAQAAPGFLELLLLLSLLLLLA